jgi:formate hydrogenlyase subunit 6/NADH:ubiquinone oxidoreductase subunit I
MRTTIYWFSGTGNSLSVAKALAQSMPDSELIPIAAAMQNSLPPVDTIGLVFPVYSFGPPAILERFIRKLNVSEESYIFCVCTCAVTSGSTLHYVSKMLNRSGLKLDGFWTVKQPENYPPLGGTPGPKSQAKTHAAAIEKTTRIAEELELRPRGHFEKTSLFYRMAGRIAYPAFRGFERHGADRFFRADKKCNSCGLCAEVCPVANIKMEESRPVWLGHCEQCFACFHWCPQNAVQYGPSGRITRYHHPAVSVADFRDQGSRLQNENV